MGDWPSVTRWLQQRRRPRVVTVPVVICYDGAALAEMSADEDGGASELTHGEVQRLRELIEAEVQRLFTHEIGVRCEVTADGIEDAGESKSAASADAENPAAVTAGR